MFVLKDTSFKIRLRLEEIFFPITNLKLKRNQLELQAAEHIYRCGPHCKRLTELLA